MIGIYECNCTSQSGGGQNLKHHGNTEGIRGHKGEKAKSAENLPKLFNNKKLQTTLSILQEMVNMLGVPESIFLSF